MNGLSVRMFNIYTDYILSMFQLDIERCSKPCDNENNTLSHSLFTEDYKALIAQSVATSDALPNRLQISIGLREVITRLCYTYVEHMLNINRMNFGSLAVS